MSFDRSDVGMTAYFAVSQSLWNRAMSFDKQVMFILNDFKSQSLWNRAMSFDTLLTDYYTWDKDSQSLWNRAMSFDTLLKDKFIQSDLLNPFGTGQCLSTLQWGVRALCGKASQSHFPTFSDV